MSGYTENLADFGTRERKMAAELLSATFPEGFSDDAVRVAFNTNSGNVFLVNDDYQVAMMNGDTLDLFHSTPYHGHEGFICDLLSENEPDSLNQDDIDYILDAAEAENADLPEAWKTAEHS